MCGHCLSSTSRSICVFALCPFQTSYRLSASSALMMVGVVPARIHRASLDVVQYGLAIRRFVSLCTLMYSYLRLLNSYLSASIQTGEQYNKSGKLASL